MEFRKLIKFGDSSFVISLPKTWVEKNGLKKGDVVGVEIGVNNQLFVLPETKPNRELTETTINLDDVGASDNLKTLVISAYLQNFDTINVIGSNLLAMSSKIRNIFQSLASIEIIEQSGKKITARSFFDPKEISVATLVRRLEVMTRSILEDAKESLSVKSKIDLKNLYDYAYQKEEDVTRLSFLVFKLLRKAMIEPETASHLKITVYDIFKYWRITKELEEIADHAKRICRYMSEGDFKTKSVTLELLKIALQHFDATMKAYHTVNRMDSIKYLQERVDIMKRCREYIIQNTDLTTYLVVDKIRRISVFTGNIANLTIDG